VATQHAHGWRAALFQSTPAAWHGRPQDSAALTEELRDVMRRGLTCRWRGHARCLDALSYAHQDRACPM